MVCITWISGIITLAVVLGLVTVKEIRDAIKHPLVIFLIVILILNGFINFMC